MSARHVFFFRSAAKQPAALVLATRTHRTATPVHIEERQLCGRLGAEVDCPETAAWRHSRYSAAFARTRLPCDSWSAGARILHRTAATSWQGLIGAVRAKSKGAALASSWLSAIHPWVSEAQPFRGGRCARSWGCRLQAFAAAFASVTAAITSSATFFGTGS